MASPGSPRSSSAVTRGAWDRCGARRTTDPKILLQLSDQPILAFSGAHPKVTAALEDADLLQLTETSGNVAYERDDARSAPHNLFVATRPLFRLATEAGVDVSAPPALFRFDEEVPDSEQAPLLRDRRVLQLERGRVELGWRSVGPAAGRRADAHGGRRGDRRRQRRDPGGRRHRFRHPRRGRVPVAGGGAPGRGSCLGPAGRPSRHRPVAARLARRRHGLRDPGAARRSPSRPARRSSS